MNVALETQAPTLDQYAPLVGAAEVEELRGLVERLYAELGVSRL